MRILPALFCVLLVTGKATAQSNSEIKIPSAFQSMEEKWELTPETRQGNFKITAYRPVYITAGRRSSNPNTRPVSENPAYSLPFNVNYNKYEAKFQLSLKSKIVRGIIAGKGDLWIGFTQKAHWQLYNEKLSRPFRELNYEPEAILNFPIRIPVLGFEARMVGLSLVHQSNGRTLPLSRSWNRIVFHAGFVRDNWQVMVRPWIRLHDEEDENPAILDYVGRGELIVVKNLKRHQFSVQASHTLRTGDKNRGSILASWVFVVHKNLKLQWQFSEGYGETLQDYNHRQATLGVSLSFIEW